MRCFRIPGVLGAVLLGIAATHASAMVIVNFDTYADGSAVPSENHSIGSQWTVVGVEFSDGAGQGVAASGNACSYTAPNHAYATLIVARFVDACTGLPSVTDMAGTRQDFCWVNGEGIDMYAFDADGNEIGHQFNAGGGNLVVFSFPEPIIARLDMYCMLQGIDEFQFNPPVAALKGDMDCNGMVEEEDIGPFVEALIDPALHAANQPGCPIEHADMNCDRKVDGLDVQGMVERLLEM